MIAVDITKNRLEKIKRICNNNNLQLISYGDLSQDYKDIIVTFKCVCGNIENKKLVNLEKSPRCKKCNNKSCGNKKRLTVEYIAIEFAKMDCTLLTDYYQNAHQKLKYKCNQCGQEYETTWNNFTKVKSLCKTCYNPSSERQKMSLHELKKKLKDMDIELYTDEFTYKNRLETKLPVKCQRCGKLQYRTFAILYKNKRCICQDCEETNLYTLQEANKIIFDKWGIRLIEYNGHKKYCKYICKCGHKNTINYYTLYTYGPWCPYCMKTRSKGEEYVKKVLLENNIEFEYEKTFEDLIYIGKLKIDFYLAKYNIAIEIDGEQHRKPVYFGNENNLDTIIMRDQIKDNYCFKNNIRMIRIPYDSNNMNEFQVEVDQIIHNIKKDSK